MTSPDGVTWTARSAAEANEWTSVTYGNGLFVAVANSGTNRVMTSPDGITWTARSAAGNDDTWGDVAYGNGVFLAINNSTPSGEYLISSQTDQTVLDTYTVIPEVTTKTGSASLTQIHYRWRNDDGDEVGATWLQAEDNSVPASFDINRGERKRLRFVLSNANSSASNYQYRIQQASSSCTSWYDVPTSNSGGFKGWVMDLSGHVSDLTPTTELLGLSDPVGKTFSPGYVMTSSNETSAMTLTSSEFTHLEYSIKSTNNAETGLTYCFRLTNAGSETGFTYTQTPAITLSSFNRGGGGNPYEVTVTGTIITGGGIGGGAGSENSQS